MSWKFQLRWFGVCCDLMWSVELFHSHSAAFLGKEEKDNFISF